MFEKGIIIDFMFKQNLEISSHFWYNPIYAKK